jgi:hypothetical protein
VNRKKLIFWLAACWVQVFAQKVKLFALARRLPIGEQNGYNRSFAGVRMNVGFAT